MLLANYQARKLLGLSIDFDLNHTTLDELLQFSQTTNRQQSLIDMKYLASDYRNAQKLDAFCWLLNTNTTCIPVQINIIPNLNFKTIEQQDKTGFYSSYMMSLIVLDCKNWLIMRCMIFLLV